MKTENGVLSIATFNTRGLKLRKQNLATDITRYGVDVCCIQETKILAGCDENINNHRLICLSTDNKAYGLGFMVHDRWKNNIAKVWKVNERISVIQFKINSKKDHIITVINVYGPHTGITKTNPQEAEKFYDKLNEIIKEQQKTTSLLVIAGDFNSVVGKRTDDDNCLGKHSSGVRNRNGQNMINFCEFNSLLVTNTCFQHSQRHKTSWEQIRVSKGKNQVNKIRKTLDYILIDDKYKHILRNSRSYQGTLVESDHRMLVTRMKIQWYIVYKKRNNKQNNNEKYNTHLLVNSIKERQEYANRIKEVIQQAPKGQKTWAFLKSKMRESAEK